MQKKTLACVLVGLLVLILAVVLTGCRTAQRKPLPDRTPQPERPTPIRTAPPPQGPNANEPMPTETKEVAALQDKLAREAASVAGVKRAWVALSGNTALVGVELESDAPRGQDDAAGLKNDISSRVRRADPRIKNVAVATDDATVARVRQIAEGVKEGKPVKTFTEDLNDLMKRMAPGVK
ncbi:MAG: YhcN/YlaJ family sporulation lipoprotein [Firmicutes bacterium]|jgi:YhcN/YlaJ family sporulation lipoprotein|nr:YhcN/YlaJ family sporulation lipoprotein [Bacillota bacterium]